MYLFFDFDGTIAETQEAVHEAYRLAGARIPKDMWGKPWHEWTTQAVHDKKNKHYEKLLQSKAPIISRGPVAWLYEEHAKLRPWIVGIITGASEKAVHAVLHALSLPEPCFLHCELTLEGKIEILKKHREGIYYDDDVVACWKIQERCKSWTVIPSQRLLFPQQVEANDSQT